MSRPGIARRPRLQTGLVGVFASLLACLSILPGAPETFAFTTRDGREIEGATFSRRTPDSVSFILPDGVKRFRFEVLPEEIQQRFSYDPERAAVYRERVREERDARVAAERERELARRTAAEREARRPERDVTLTGRVSSVTGTGVMIVGARATVPQRVMAPRQVQVDGPTTLSPNRPRQYRTVIEEVERPVALELGDGVVYLESAKFAAEAVDGQRVREKVFAIGRHVGGGRTLARFTTDEERAHRFAETGE